MAAAAASPRLPSKAKRATAEAALADFRAHRCSLSVGPAAVCLAWDAGSAATPTQLTAAEFVLVRELVLHNEIDERGRTEITAELLAGHVHGCNDHRILGRHVCAAAFRLSLAISEDKYRRACVTAQAPAAGAGVVGVEQGWSWCALFAHH